MRTVVVGMMEDEMAAINERVKRDRWDVSLELINGLGQLQEWVNNKVQNDTSP